MKEYGIDTVPMAVARGLAGFVLLFSIQCGLPPPPGDSPDDDVDTGIPPIELPSCPDKAFAGWSPLGDGLDDHVWDLAAADAESPVGPALYACGNFLKADGQTVNHVARWDGSKWSPLSGPSGTGTDAACTAIEISPIDGMLYAGGGFEKAGGEWVFRWAKWDGSKWSDEPLRLEGGYLYDLQYHDLHGSPDPEQVAGGTFENGNQLLFNGLAWSSPSAHGNLGPYPDVGLNCSVNCSVLALEEHQSELYVAGYFDSLGGLKTHNIARLVNLNSFTPLAQGVGDPANNTRGIQDMASYNGELYVGGFFAEASGVPASEIARWNGESWSDVEVGVNGIVEGLLTANIGDGTALYVAGFFNSAGDTFWTTPPPGAQQVPAQYIARYKSGTWSALGAGLGPYPGPTSDNHGMVMTTWDDGNGTCLYVAGRFQTAGGVEASNIARWCCS